MTDDYFQSILDESDDQGDDLFAGEVRPKDPPIPAGSYVCRVLRVSNKLNHNGNRYALASYEIIHGEYTGRKLYQKLWLTAKAKQYTIEKLRDLFLIDSMQKLQDNPDLTGYVYKIATELRTTETGQYSEVQAAKRFALPADQRPKEGGEVSGSNGAPKPEPGAKLKIELE